MNNLDFIRRIQAFFDDCILEIKRKNPDYAHQDVPLYDMFHTAFEEHVAPESVLRVLLTKHWSAIRAWTAGHTLTSETLEGRLTDSANYIGFLAMLSQEEGPALVQAIWTRAAIEKDWPFHDWVKKFYISAFDRK